MIQHTAIFLSAHLIVITAQMCCSSSSAVSANKRSINILIPIPYPSIFPGLSGLRSGMSGLPRTSYFGYFTRYLGPASANGICPAGVNINGLCWYNSIGNNK